MSVSHVKVDRVSLAFPGQQAGSQIAKGLPHLPGYGLVSFPTVDSGGSAYANPTGSGDLVAHYGQRVVIPCDTIAIGIAPDSIVHSCDIWIAGRNGAPDRHRVSPGNPYIGCPEADYVIVTVPNSIPALSTSFQYEAWSEHIPAYSLGAGTQVPGFPLRLEIMRGGGVVPMRAPVRSPQFERAAFIDVDTGENGGVRDFYVCVDGRKQIRVTISNGGSGDCTVQCWAWEGMPSNDDTDDATLIPLALDDAGATSLTIATGIVDMISFDGAPITILQVRVTAAANNANIFVTVGAWD